MRGLAVGGLVVILVVGLAYAVLNLGKNGVPSTANLPSVGEIWFGTSFNPTTFELTGRTSSVNVGSTVAMVAHLSRSISSGQANLRLSLNGTTIANQAITNLQGGGDLFGSTLGGILFPGSYRYEITDIGGNVLAAGTLTVTQ